MRERLPDHPPEYDDDPLEKAAAELADKIINELGYPTELSYDPRLGATGGCKWEHGCRPNFITRKRMVEIAVEILEAWDAEFP